jgi:GAF domain-containing protein
LPPEGYVTRRGTVSRKPAKTPHRKSASPKRSNAPTATRRPGSSAADQEKQFDLHTRDLDEAQKHLAQALEQQSATSEILGIIARSPTDVPSVLNAICQSAARLCEAYDSSIWRPHGDRAICVAHHGPITQVESVPLVRGSVVGRSIIDKRAVHIADLQTQAAEFPVTSEYARRLGFRAGLYVPLLRDGAAFGSIALRRKEARLFTERQAALLQIFADQAVIAIENTRLLNELRESLQQQTATADVLKVISRSAFDLQTVFNTLVESAARLCRANQANIARVADEQFRYVAAYGFPPGYLEHMQARPRPIDRGSASGRAVLEGGVVHIHDVLADSEFALLDAQKLGHFRTVVAVPLLRERTAIGALFLTRPEVEPFTQNQLELLTTFADQAVIAIENTRLLNELRESLQQQTATADVLKVVSRSTFHLQAVLDTLVQSAARLCEADTAAILRLKGSNYRHEASYGFPPDVHEHMASVQFELGRGTIAGRTALSRNIVHVHDVLDDQEYILTDLIKRLGARTMLGVPLLREGTPIGVIVLNRGIVRPFTDKQIELVETFADQAVIAIENVRLFEEVRARTRELSETLQQQIATANVLEVISRSAFDLRRVFDTVAESAVTLCEAERAFIFRFDGELLQLAAAYNATPGLLKFAEENPIRPGRHSGSARAALERRTIHIPDARSDPEYTYGALHVDPIRTLLGVPILKGDDLLGVIMIYRLEMKPFTEKQIALVETFADQAAIAIENVRLFSEVQARTNELARSVEEQRALGAVSQAVNSTLDLQMVLDTIVAKATQISGTEAGAIYVLDERQGEFQLSATFGMSDEVVAAVRNMHAEISEAVGLLTETHEPSQQPDLSDLPPSRVNDIVLREGYRARLVVPLMRSEKVIGALVVRRKAPGEFPISTVDLLKTFAAQSAVAIQNARLFHELEEKGRQLAEASQHKSQFLANMSHELRTPLNAILGYTELILDSIYGDVPEKTRAVLDRIQRNGRHLLGLINEVLDLSKIEAGQLILSLADYSLKNVVETVFTALEQLAKEKKLAFTFDVAPDLPRGYGDERRLTQVMLNLAGNAIKFTDKGEITIQASAANGSFEVAVRDTGPGISETDQAKLFQEFQQADNSITRKKGGTGLGLAISKRIIEMHGGRIRVESVVGQGSTFSFELPVMVKQQVKK